MIIIQHSRVQLELAQHLAVAGAQQVDADGVDAQDDLRGEALEVVLARKVEGVDALATSITSYARATSATFPNVTIPHFDIRAQEIAELTGAEMIMFIPFVEEADREAFEVYAVQHQGWIAEGIVSIKATYC